MLKLMFFPNRHNYFFRIWSAAVTASVKRAHNITEEPLCPHFRDVVRLRIIRVYQFVS